MTLMVNQGHQQWHNSIGYISLSVSGLK